MILKKPNVTLSQIIFILFKFLSGVSLLRYNIEYLHYVTVAQDNRQCAITLNSDRELHVFPTSLKSSSTCGSKDFPWKVEAYKGQAINISLLINESDTSKSNFDHEPKVCLNNLFESYIVDSNEKRKVPICGNGRLGNSLFFVTSSNTVHIFFNPKKSEDKLISEYGILRLTGN